MNKLIRLLAALFALVASLGVNAQVSSAMFDENLTTDNTVYPPVTSLGFGWNSWSWGIATPTLETPPTLFKGQKAAKIVFNAPWGAFSPGVVGGSGYFSTVGYKELNLAIYNVSGGSSLHFIAGTSAGSGTDLLLTSYSETNTIPTGKWTWFRIPISHLNLGPNPQIKWVAIEDPTGSATIFVDELRFDINTTLFEGVAGTKGPGTYLFSWGGPTPTIGGTPDNYWIDFTPTSAYGGIQVHEIYAGWTMPSASYTHVAVNFQKTTSTQRLNGQLVDHTNTVVGSVVNLENYIVPSATTATPGKWYRAMIPLSAILGGSTADMGGFIITSSEAVSFKIDDVKFIDNTMGMIMRFPIQTANYPLGAYTPQRITSILDHYMSTLYSKEGKIVSFTGEEFEATPAYPMSAASPCYPIKSGSWSGFLASLYVGTSGTGVKNCTSGTALNYDAHPGYDYSAITGTVVRAAASGVVVNQNGGCVPKGISEGCAAWGAIGIDHGNGFISQYLHLSRIDVVPGQAVVDGQQIGLSGNISPPTKPVGQHLHFETLKLRSGYSNDYQPNSYATVDPYGYNGATGVLDYLANINGTPSFCLWLSGCRF